MKTILIAGCFDCPMYSSEYEDFAPECPYVARCGLDDNLIHKWGEFENFTGFEDCPLTELKIKRV